MENPVVVFVLKDRCGNLNRQFPIGWTEAGECLEGVAAIDGKQCCVIFLEDDKEVPKCCHANKDAKQPLPVIIHVNSGKYKSTTIANTELVTWGIPICRNGDSFSHIEGEGIFQEILELLRDSSCAKSFAQKRQTANDLDVLDKLAALCQICMIDPNTKANVRSFWDLFYTLPDGDFKDHLLKAQKKGWPAALNIIATRANELPSKPLNQKNENQHQSPSLEKTHHDS